LFGFDALILIVVGAFLLALILIPISTKIAWKVGAIDYPTDRSSHGRPVPRLGGFGVVLALIATLFICLPINSMVIAFFSGLLIVAIVGFIDDIHRLSSKVKFFWQIIAALIFIYLGGGAINSLGDLFGLGAIQLGWLAIPFTVFVMVGGINTINLSDGLDGLAAGLAMIASVFLALFAWQIGCEHIVIMALALSGAILGFLRFNTYPARLFMGDIGSLSIGYSLSAFLVFISNCLGDQIQIISIVLVLALPILDTLLVMGRRIYYGHAPFSPDKTHLHHRLLALHIPHSLVVSIMYVLMASFGLAAIALHSQPAWMQFCFLFVYGGVIFGSIIYAQHKGFNWKKIQKASRSNSLEHHRITRLASQYGSQINRLLLVVCILPIFLFAQTDTITGLFPLILSGLLLLVIWSHRQEYERVLMGCVYVAIVVSLFEFNIAAENNPFYKNYLWISAALISAWVIYKLLICNRFRVLFTTGFELLLLMVVWFIPFIALPFLDDELVLVQQSLRFACVQSVPVFLLIKLHFSRDTGNHFMVLGGFAFVLVTIWVRGNFGF